MKQRAVFIVLAMTILLFLNPFALAEETDNSSAYATVNPAHSTQNLDTENSNTFTWISLGSVLSFLLIVFVFRPLKPSSLAP